MSTIRIPLNSRKHPGLFALIDEHDYELVSQYRWNVQPGRNTFYAVASIYDAETGRSTQVKMHRLIASPPESKVIDHLDGDGLNNIRQNLRITTHKKNLRNRLDRKSTKSAFTGVYFDKRSAKNPWKAFIGVPGKTSPMYLGRYSTELDAALAYDQAIDTFSLVGRNKNIGVETVEVLSKGGFD